MIVASDGLIPGKPVVYRAFDLGSTAPAVSDGFSTAGLGRVLYTDVAFHQDHVFFAVIVALSRFLPPVLRSARRSIV